MKQIIVFPRGQLTELDRARMDEVGIVAIEADDPKSVVTVIPAAPLATSDDLAMAALWAVTFSGSGSTALTFAKTLHERLQARDTVANQYKGSGNG